MKNPSPRFALLAATALGTSFSSIADAQEDVFLLDEIVVSGTGLPTEVLKSPVTVTVIGEEAIEKVPPSSVAAILKEVPGVRVSESGIEYISIRGESSTRTGIMIDGQAVNDHGTYGVPVLISPTEIERIEVVRGSASVVAGNRAQAGSINIITKRGADKPMEATVSAGYLGATAGYRASTSLAGTINNFDYRLSYSTMDQGDLRSPLGTLDNSSKSDSDLHAFLGYRHENHYVGFRAQDYQFSADVYTGDEDFLISLPKRDLRKYSAFYEGEDLTDWMSMFKIGAFTQQVDRIFEHDMTLSDTMKMLITSDDEQVTSGFNMTANMEFAANHRTVVGFEYEHDNLKTDKLTQMFMFGMPLTPSTHFTDATIETTSVFAQHEVTMGNLIATLGARYYHVDSRVNKQLDNGLASGDPLGKTSDDRLLGSFGLVYEVDDATTLRANLSQGYTYPTLSQLYIDTETGGQTIIGNPDLAPETSTSFEVGARMNRGAFILDASAFYTKADNYIASIYAGEDASGNDYWQYQNINAADTHGFEVAAEWDTMHMGGLRPYASLAHISRKFKYENGFSTRDSGTPTWSGDLGLRSDWMAGNVTGTWDAFVRGESGSDYRDDSGVVTDSSSGWATLNLRVSAELRENLSVNFEANNLLDKTYSAANTVLYGAGRHVSLFMTAKF